MEKENEKPAGEAVNGAEDESAEENAAQNCEEAEEAEEQSGRKHSKQKKEHGKAKLEKKLEEAEKEIDRLKDQLLRSQAEFQNFKRRNSSVYAEAYAKATEDALREMLPVLDNLERAVAAAEGDSPLKAGVEMTLRQFTDCASKLGMEEVPALGEMFDPEKHNAVMRSPGDTPGMILEVFQKGYRVKDKIIRFPMVRVASDE